MLEVLLKSISLENFRGFADHRIEFGPETLLIGQNNAGKTTAIEALRVLSVCQAKIPNAQLTACPSWLDGFCQGAGFRVSLETIDFDFANVQHSYNTEKPAIIKAKNSNNSEIRIYIGTGPDQVFCQIRTSQNKVVFQRSEINSKIFGKTKVMPPVGSLLPREKAIAKDRLRRYMDGYLAYRHFRNQLWELPSDYRLFRELLENTWPNISIQHFESDHGESQNEFSLLVREGRFTSEVSWHGHGLQAWMQTIWFLARTEKSATIVLDEPDVYLHADLQRKLIKVIEGLNFKQSIIATHSPEIIGDVPFQNVTVVQKRDRVSRPAEKAREIQEALSGMGSLHSIQMAKVAQQGLILIVEGDDKPFLSDVAYKIGTRYFDVLSKIAIHELNGKGNWHLALGAAKTLKFASDGQIATTLLLDRDYMLDEEIESFYKKANGNDLNLKIWKRKEIENYFIMPEVFQRIINRSCDKVCDLISIEDMLREVESELMTDVVLSFADVIQKFERSRGKAIEPKTAFARAKKFVDEKIYQGEALHHLASGKEIISSMSRKSQDLFGVSFSPLTVCKEARLSEIPQEMKEFVEALCR